jgi:hypothetical protein
LLTADVIGKRRDPVPPASTIPRRDIKFLLRPCVQMLDQAHRLRITRQQLRHITDGRRS